MCFAKFSLRELFKFLNDSMYILGDIKNTEIHFKRIYFRLIESRNYQLMKFVEI